MLSDRTQPVKAVEFTHNMLVFALSTGVTYESFIKTGLIA